MPPPRTQSGFALIDTLIALLLFATVVLTAIAALLQGMRAMHAAALTGRAVDLAADLLEQQRALPAGVAPGALHAAWHQRLAAELPEAARGAALALIPPPLPAHDPATP